MKHLPSIPVLNGNTFDDSVPYSAPQPIIQFKELTPDTVRYQLWKDWIRLHPAKKPSTKKGTNK